MTTRHAVFGPPAPPGRSGEPRGGVALIIAVMVLAALFLMAMPFAAFMRAQHRTSTQAMQTAQARYGEAGALAHARTVLAQGHFASEQTRPVFPYDNPHVDTPFEFRVTLRTVLEDGVPDDGEAGVEVANALGFPNDGDEETVDGYLLINDEWVGYSDVALHDPADPGTLFPGGTLLVREEHRGLFGTEPAAHPADSLVSFFPADELWHVDIEDEQSKININTASERLLQNLMYYAFDEAGLDTTNADDIGSDIYEQRRTAAGEYRPYRSVSEMKSRAGLSEEQFQVLERYVTISSALLPGQRLWQPVGSLLTDTADLADSALHLTDGASGRVPPGALLRIRRWNGTDWDTYYGETSGKSAGGLQLAAPVGQGGVTVRLAWDPRLAPRFSEDGLLKVGSEWMAYTTIATDSTDPDDVQTLELTVPAGGRGLFGTDERSHPPGTTVEGDVVVLDDPLPVSIATDDDYQIHVLSTHAVNINTVTSEVVLRALLDGLESDLFGGVDIDGPTAGALAAALLRWDGMEDLTELDIEDDFFANRSELDEAVEDAGLSDAQEWLVKRSLDPRTPGGWQSFWTAPVRFNSGDISRIASMSVVDDPARTPVAQSPPQPRRAIVRAHFTPPMGGQPVTYWVRSQQEFHHALAGGGSSGVISTELNTDLPESMLAEEDDWADIEPGVGAVAPEPLRLNVTDYTTALLGLNALRLPDYHLDLTFARGDREGQTEADVDNLRNLGLTGEGFTFYTDFDRSLPALRNIQAEPVHTTIQPFAIECWVRYRADAGRRYVFDMGGDDGPDTDRVSLYFEGGQLHFAIGDQTGQGSAVITSTDTFQEDTWYHIAVAATGTHDGEMAMFIDGVYDAGATPGAPDRYLLPVARRVPAGQYTVSENPDPEEDAWPAGEPLVGLTSTDGLPDQGVITINHSTAGTIETYVYTELHPLGLVLAEDLRDDAEPGDRAAHAIPVARTDPEAGAVFNPGTDTLVLYRHDNLTGVDDELDAWGNPDLVASGVLMGDFKDGADVGTTLGDDELRHFWYLGLDPANPAYEGGLGGETELNPWQRRWKVGNEAAGHSGSLPCDPGDYFTVGAANDGSDPFGGLIDQFRITSLATAMVPEGGWTVAAPDPEEPPPPPVRLTEWAWRTDVDADNPPLMPKAEADALPRHPLIAVLQLLGSEAEELPAAGYLLVEGDEESYFDYEDGDIRFTGAVTAAEFRRVLPLSHIAATRFESFEDGTGFGGRGDIQVEDTLMFPPVGYVEIGGEIIGYGSKRSVVPDPTDPDDQYHFLVRMENTDEKSMYPRGAFDTTVGTHSAGDIVRYVPVRFPDRYRVEFDGTFADWDEHALYSEHQLTNQATMFSFSVPAADSLLRTVRLRFKEPLEADQRVVVLINLDPANQPWGINPATIWPDPEEVDDEDAMRVELEKLDDSLLWGYVCDPVQLNDAPEIWIEPRDQDGDVPVVAGSTAEVRVYFDLSETDRSAVLLLELDALGVEIVPTATSF